MAPKGSSSSKPLYFVGNNWVSSVTVDDLWAFRAKYDIPSTLKLEVPDHREALVNAHGMAGRMALYPLMFANGLRLPFCRPIRDILNFLGRGQPRDWAYGAQRSASPWTYV